MPSEFTFFSKFSEALSHLPVNEGRELAYAIAMYGGFGKEVELSSYVTEALFAALKEDVDNSKSARTRGAKGGRPKKEPQVSSDEKPEVSEDAPQTENLRFPVWVPGGETQTKPSHDHIQAIRSVGDNARAFEPPSVEDAASLFAELLEERGNRTLNAENIGRDFVSHYAAQGWVRSNGVEVADWKALAAVWLRNEVKEPRSRTLADDASDVYSRL